MAPGKKGASITPRKNLTVSKPAGELVALVHPLTIAHAMMQDGYTRLATMIEMPNCEHPRGIGKDEA